MTKGLILSFIILTSLPAFASTKSICGNDDRVLSFNPKVGRLSVDGKHKGCTATLIGNSCAITAGHCEPVLERAEFNTPVSIENEPQASDLKDLYLIDKSSIKFNDGGPGKDWAVFKFKANEITNKLPGTVQGNYNISYKKFAKGENLTIIGYGLDDGDLDKNFAQQIHTGKVKAIGDEFYGESVLKHNVDTMGGNSGSSILLESTEEIVAIHTHGGCSTYSGFNMGTIISLQPELIEAIKTCLASE